MSSPSRIERERTEEGAAAVLVAILALPVIVGLCAIGVDAVRLHLAASRLQTAVDAAALAGAVLLPTSPQGAASQASRALGAGLRSATLVSAKPVAGRPTRLRVVASLVAPTSLGALIGPRSFTLSRAAEADFAAPLIIASPCNVFGNELMSPAGGGVGQAPVGTGACGAGAGQYWANVSGELTNKARGDAFSARWCTLPDAPPIIDGCSPATGRITPPGTNLEYRGSGYDFLIRVPRAGSLSLQGYDLGFVPAGDECTGFVDAAGVTHNPLLGASAITSNEYVSTTQPPNPRYAGANGPYCAGDGHVAGVQGATGSPDRVATTTVVVRGPLQVPGTPGSGPVVCALQVPGVDGYSEKLASLLKRGVGGARGLLVRRTFHRWAEICPSRLGVSAGEYVVTVSTAAGGGQNRFALRASLGSAAADAGLTVSALERVSLYANVPAGTSVWRVLRLDSSVAGRRIRLRLFDVGDAAQAVTVTIEDADTGVPWPACQVSGALTGERAPCRIQTVSGVTGGRWVELQLDVPSAYRCAADTDMGRCWLRARMSSPSVQHDTTTWTAGVAGDPVRIVR